MKGKGLLALLLSIAMTVSMMPAAVFAADDFTEEGSTETAVSQENATVEATEEGVSIEIDDPSGYIDNAQSVIMPSDVTVEVDPGEFVYIKDGERYRNHEEGFPDNILEMLTYQWYKGTYNEDWDIEFSKITGATSSSCTANNLTEYTELKCEVFFNGKYIGYILHSISKDDHVYFNSGENRYWAAEGYSKKGLGFPIYAKIGSSFSFNPADNGALFYVEEKGDEEYWDMVSPSDSKWSIEWKDEDGNTISSSTSLSIANVTVADFKEYICWVSYDNEFIGVFRYNLGEDINIYFEDGGTQYRGQLDFYDMDKRAKLGDTTTLDPNFYYPGYKFYNVSYQEEDYWLNIFDDLEQYMTFKWTKDGSEAVVGTDEVLEANIETAEDFGKYYCEVFFKGHSIGTLTVNVTEETRKFISINNDSTYEHPKNGDLLIDLYTYTPVVRGLEGQYVYFDVSLYAECWNAEDEYWEYYGIDYDQCKYNWKLDGESLGNTEGFLDRKIQATDFDKTFSCSVDAKIGQTTYKIGEVEFSIVEGMGFEWNDISGNQFVYAGETTTLKSDNLANYDNCNKTYQWCKVTFDDDYNAILEDIPEATKTTYTTETIDEETVYACKVTLHDIDENYEDYTETSNYFWVYPSENLGNLGVNKTVTSELTNPGYGIYTFVPTKSGWYEFYNTTEDANSAMVDCIQDPGTTYVDQYYVGKIDGYKAKLTKGKTYQVCVRGENYDDEDKVVFQTTSRKRVDPSAKVATLPLKLKQSVTAKSNLKLESDEGIMRVTTSNKKVVSVSSSGKLTGKKTGTATIKVYTSCGDIVSYKVKVQKGDVAIKSLSVSCGTKVNLKKGKSLKIGAVKSPVTCKTKINYSSSNKKVATVSSSGTIKGKKKGKATITVKCGKRSKKIKVTVS